MGLVSNRAVQCPALSMTGTGAECKRVGSGFKASGFAVPRQHEIESHRAKRMKTLASIPVLACPRRALGEFHRTLAIFEFVSNISRELFATIFPALILPCRRDWG